MSTFQDFERWLLGFADVVGQFTDYQKLRVSRVTTPSKLCGGAKCLLINARRCPVILGIDNL